ncbi:insulinase family protein, partial [bacterium]|nr:insulinase family protein [bacterium]
TQSGTTVDPLRVGQFLDGFAVDAVTPVPELRGIAYQLRHERTGARLLDLHVPQDAENLFSINFPTPPTDDTGVPHILEHSVLAGSRRFPVRDPFFELTKLSMATFLNAMTGWDCTYYPVASNVRQDLFNLAEVYFDAVFHPLLTRETFEREGHHLAPADPARPDADLALTGIVYNEMKGAFSDPESRLYRQSIRSLFPDTIYSRESGGDPVAIPDLTYEGLQRFHAAWYHPSNAWFVCYGNLPPPDWTAFLGDRLASFTQREPAPAITRQPRWSAPRRLADTYPVAPGESLREKTYVVTSWLVGDAADPEDAAAVTVLSRLLLGHEAAPLRRAVIVSRLGQDVVQAGAGSAGWESTFSVGLKGSEPDRADAYEQVVLDALGRIAADPFPPAEVAAAFQQTNYSFREINSGHPLHVLDRVLSCALYGVDPLAFCRAGEHLEAVRRRYAADPAYFNRLARDRLVDNRHRLTTVLRPDHEWQARTDAAVAARLQRVRAGLSEQQLQVIARRAAALDEQVGTPNTPEQVASLPQLSVGDLPARPAHIPTTVADLGDGARLLVNDVFTNGVNYLSLSFDLHGLPSDLLPYLPRHADAVRKLGAAGQTYQELAHRQAATTGGIDSQSSFGGHAVHASRTVRELRFHLKALDDQLEPALALVRDLVFAVDPHDRDRLREVVTQARAFYRTEFVENGAATAARTALRGLHPAGQLNHVVHGLPQLPLLDRFHADYDRSADELMQRIEQVRAFLLSRARLTASFTGSNQGADLVRQALRQWLSSMTTGQLPEDSLPGFTPDAVPSREGLAAAMQVAYCLAVLPARHLADPTTMLLSVGAQLVNLDYMISEIRFKGNAYGAWCRYDPLLGVLQLGSYRDPHVARTLAVFRGLRDYVRRINWSRAEVDRAIIGTAKRFVYPIRPQAATNDALGLHLAGDTRAAREQRYASLRGATPAAIKQALLEVLEAHLDRAAICVVSGREQLAEANRQMPDEPLAIQNILPDSTAVHGGA